MSGWIKLHRKMLEWEWYSKPVVKSVFIHSLLRANHKDGKWQGKEVKRGSYISSVDKLIKELGHSRQEIRTALKHLKSTNEITTAGGSQHTVFIVVNYDSYQDATSDLTNEQPAANQQSTTNKNVKNEKNDNNITDAFNFFWLNMKMKRAAKQNAERSFNKLAAKESDPMVFAEMLVEDTTQRFNLNQFGFDKLNPTTYLNQKRWEDDKPENLSEEYKYILDAYNEATEKTLMPSAEIVTDKMIFMVKDLYAKTTLTPETIGNYFKYIATKPEFDWIRGEKENSSPMDLTYILSMEIYAKAKGKRK